MQRGSATSAEINISIDKRKVSDERQERDRSIETVSN